MRLHKNLSEKSRSQTAAEESTEERKEKILHEMASNITSDLANDTTPKLPHPCFYMGQWAWQKEFLTPRTAQLLVAVISIEVPTALVTFFINAMVIWAVWRKRYLRKQNPCVLLACLATTDLLVGAIVLPLLMTGHAFRLSSKPVCFMDTITSTCLPVACVVSLSHLVVISGERYVAVKHALRYETLVTTHRLAAAIATAWAIPVFVAAAGLISATLMMPCYLFGVFIYVPGSIALIFFYQVALFLESRRHRRDICQQVSQAEAMEILKKDKAARTTSMIVGALLLCYASSIVYNGVILAVFSDSIPRSLVAMSGYSLDLIVCWNSLINPVIYCLRTRDFQRAFRELLNIKNPETDPRNERVGANNTAERPRENNEPRAGSSHRERSRKTHPELKHSRTRSLNLSTEPSRRKRTLVRKHSI